MKSKAVTACLIWYMRGKQVKIKLVNMECHI
jgi:hypothetical protein